MIFFFYQLSPISDTYLPSAFSNQGQSTCIKLLGGRFIGVKTIGEPSSGWSRGDRGRLIEVAAFNRGPFYLQYCADNSFGTLITSRLIGVRLYLRLKFVVFVSFRTSAAEKYPVVVTELTFPSVTVESVPFTIQTGKNQAHTGLVYHVSKPRRSFL